MKIGTWEYNETQRIAADVLLAAEEAILCGNKKKAIEDAKGVLSLPGASAYYPAARAVLSRCGAKSAKRKLVAA